jgi:hypothetical protein
MLAILRKSLYRVRSMASPSAYPQKEDASTALPYFQ